jgi:undecaprenyl-diphosphatase
LAVADRLDLALFQAVTSTRTPVLDSAFAGLSRAADYSRLSILFALELMLAGGPEGRRSARRGMASVAVTAAVVNLALKPVIRRRRPDRRRIGEIGKRWVKTPASNSFPSGHSAAAFAFATGVGREVGWVRSPLYAFAGLVGYSRVHTGVHYPLDVVTGALCGVVLAGLTGASIDRMLRVHQSQGVSLPTRASCSR